MHRRSFLTGLTGGVAAMLLVRSAFAFERAADAPRRAASPAALSAGDLDAVPADYARGRRRRRRYRYRSRYRRRYGRRGRRLGRRPSLVEGSPAPRRASAGGWRRPSEFR